MESGTQPRLASQKQCSSALLVLGEILFIINVQDSLENVTTASFKIVVNRKQPETQISIELALLVWLS